jgi:tetratricopeptide (TPR) repeat protein
MAVFPGGCTLESAETVCRADLDILSTLVDHSLAQRAVARRYLEDLDSLATGAGLEVHAITAKLNLGSLVLDSGDPAAAVPIFEEALAFHRRQGSQEGIGFGCLNLGQAAYRLGRYGTARERFHEARTAFDSIGFRELAARALQGLAGVEASDGSVDEAARLLGQADAVLEEVGASAKEYDVALVSEVEAEARAHLGDEGFAAAYAEGKSTAIQPA